MPPENPNDDTAELTPVFVDPTGRRRRVLRRVAIVGVVLIATYVVLLVAAMLGARITPFVLLPLPSAPTEDHIPPPATSTTAPHPGTASPVPAGPATTTRAAPASRAEPNSPPATDTSPGPAPSTQAPAPSEKPTSTAKDKGPDHPPGSPPDKPGRGTGDGR